MDSTNAKESYEDGEPLLVNSRNSPSNFFWNKIEHFYTLFKYPTGLQKMVVKLEIGKNERKRNDVG